MKSRQVESKNGQKLSRSLSKVLRHTAIELGIEMDAQGFVRWADLQGKVTTFQKYSIEQLQEVVREDAKQRYTLKVDTDRGLMIRANQGHSITHIQAEALLTRISFQIHQDMQGKEEKHTHYCVHGTYQKNWSSIVSTGLSRRGRNHIHMVPFASVRQLVENIHLNEWARENLYNHQQQPFTIQQTKQISQEFSSTLGTSGMRANVEVMIVIDMMQAMRDGIAFYRSSNGVILSPGVGSEGILSIKYFALVWDVVAKKRVLF